MNGTQLTLTASCDRSERMPEPQRSRSQCHRAISPSCRRDRPLLTAMLVTTLFWWPCAGNVTVGGRTVLRHSLQACILGLPKRPTPMTKPNHITSPNRSARALKIQQPTAISEAWRSAGPLLPPCACLAPAPRPSLPALVTIWSHPCQTWKRVLRALLLMNRPNPKRTDPTHRLDRACARCIIHATSTPPLPADDATHFDERCRAWCHAENTFRRDQWTDSLTHLGLTLSHTIRAAGRMHSIRIPSPLAHTAACVPRMRLLRIWTPCAALLAAPQQSASDPCCDGLEPPQRGARHTTGCDGRGASVRELAAVPW